ncbi:MAG: hypothetical protein ACTSRB_14700 [Candidatus Helarchaeota archaeon]
MMDLFLWKSYNWIKRSKENEKKWGVQTLKDLGLAMSEELGELVREILHYFHESGSLERIQEELDDLAALIYQTQHRLVLEGKNDGIKENTLSCL